MEISLTFIFVIGGSCWISNEVISNININILFKIYDFFYYLRYLVYYSIYELINNTKILQ